MQPDWRMPANQVSPSRSLQSGWLTLAGATVIRYLLIRCLHIKVITTRLADFGRCNCYQLFSDVTGMSDISLPFILLYDCEARAIHLSSNWREHEKILAKWEKWEAYRWHFVNRLANHFSHLAFRHSRQAISIFTKRQRTIRQVSRQFSRRIKDEQNWRYCEKYIVIGSPSYKIVHEIVHEHVETWETISVQPA